MSSTDQDESGQPVPLKLNPFQREQALSPHCQPQRVTQRPDGTLEIHLTNQTEIRNMLALKEISFKARDKQVRKIEVKVEPHPFKNSVRGVITCPDLRGVADDEVVDGMEGQGVTHARRIRRKVKGSLMNTDSIVLTLNRPTLPREVKVGYLVVPIRAFLPDPVRCFKCQAFGHVSSKCRGTQRCGVCSAEGHGSDACQSDSVKCANCGGQHRAWHRKCPKFVFEAEVRALMTKENVSFREARDRVRQRTPAPSLSYRDVAARPPQPAASRVALGPGVSGALRKAGNLRQLSVAELIQLLSGLIEDDTPPAPAADSVPAAPAADARRRAESEDDWTVVHPRRRPSRRQSPTATVPPSPGSDRAISPAVLETLRRGEEERRARDAKRARLAEKAREGRPSPAVNAPAGSPAMPPPPPPPLPRRPPPPSLGAASGTLSVPDPAPSPPSSVLAERRRSAKRGPPSPPEQGPGRVRFGNRTVSGPVGPRSQSADGRQRTSHARIQYESSGEVIF